MMYHYQLNIALNPHSSWLGTYHLFDVVLVLSILLHLLNLLLNLNCFLLVHLFLLL